MSGATATAGLRPVKPLGGAPSRVTPLHLAAQRAATAGRVPFVVLVVTLLATGLITLLMLHTLAAQDAFRLHALQRRAAALSEQQQQLAVALQHQQAPAALAARARRLGMVPSGSFAFIRLLDGRIVGVAGSAAAPAAASSAGTRPTSRTPAGVARPAASPSPAAAHQRGHGHRSG